MRYLLTIAILLMAASASSVNLKTYTICEGGGCDYTTVGAAESAHDQDLVANDSALTFEIQNTWVSDDAQVFIAGWTTDATRFLTIQAVGAAKAGATYSTTAWRIEHGTGSDVFNVAASFTVIDGLQFNSTHTGTTTHSCLRVAGAGADVVIKNCFLKGSTGTNTYGILWSHTTTTIGIIRNNVIIDCTLRGVNASTAAGGIKVDNNTIENCGTGIFTGSNDVIARNNILWNNTTPLSGNFNTGTLSEENYTDAGSLSYGSCGSCGTGDQVSQSDPFENIGGENYLLASGATAIDAGKDLSADFTDAIGGKTRDANFDKGADEFIAEAATGTTLEGVTLQGVTVE